MRGKAAFVAYGIILSRITPAYAGKSIVAVTEVSPYRDHPRLCGEKVHVMLIQQLELGSPPPMRGKACGRADL